VRHSCSKSDSEVETKLSWTHQPATQESCSKNARLIRTAENTVGARPGLILQLPHRHALETLALKFFGRHPRRAFLPPLRSPSQSNARQLAHPFRHSALRVTQSVPRPNRSSRACSYGNGTRHRGSALANVRQSIMELDVGTQDTMSDSAGESAWINPSDRVPMALGIRLRPVAPVRRRFNYRI
jgi:hypothetical protein